MTHLKVIGTSHRVVWIRRWTFGFYAREGVMCWTYGYLFDFFENVLLFEVTS